MSHKPMMRLKRISPKQIISTYREFLEKVDTPVALGVALRIKYGEFDQYANMGINPRDYTCPFAFKLDYQAVKGLSKASFLETNIDRRKAAIDKFWEAEGRCKVTNRKFELLSTSEGARALANDDPEMWSMLSRARHEISRIVGQRPPSNLFDRARFGPGVTSLVKGRVTLPKKYGPATHITPGLFPHIYDVHGPVYMSSLEDVAIVPGNTVSFVPKNAKTDRAIAVEPHSNVYAQLALGDVLSERYSARLKIDFKADGAALNRYYASVAKEWNLATVDLSMASDTIARALIWFLFPEDWCWAFELTRSAMFSILEKDRVSRWYISEKMSSMGNGFTFEMESILFYALARAAGSSRSLTSSFGDDIVCEARVTEKLYKLLNFCGFLVNEEKSFTSGSFYESCGEDYFDGVNVRPFFWKEVNETLPFKVLNDISSFASLKTGGRDSHYRPVYNSFLNYLKMIDEKYLRCRIPNGYGDVGIVSEWDETCPPRLNDGLDGWRTKALLFRPRYEFYPSRKSALLASLDTGSGQSKAPIRQVGSYVVASLATFGCWEGPGPWV